MLLALLPLLIVILYLQQELDSVTSANRRLASGQFQAAVQSLAILQSLDDLEEFGAKFLVSGDEGYTHRYKEAQDTIHHNLRLLHTLNLSVNEAKATEDFTRSWHLYLKLRLPINPEHWTQTTPEERTGASSLLASRASSLRDGIQKVFQSTQSSTLAQVRATTAISERTERISLFAIGGALLLSIIMLAITLRSISKPLKMLMAGTHAVSQGTLSYRVQETSNDEFGELSHAFNDMVENLWRLSRTQSEFVSHASHELKTPIVSMQETNRLLLDEVPGPLTNKQRRFVELNLASAERLSSMIADLLDLSSLEAGVRYDFKQHVLEEIIASGVEEMEARAKSESVNLLFQPNGQHTFLRCDANRITQVLQNLLDNAIKATPKDGEVQITVTLISRSELAKTFVNSSRVFGHTEHMLENKNTKQPFVLLGISDTGPGIPEDERAKVFDRFYQSQSNKTERRAHVGLGLAICREIVLAHGGAIWVTDSPSGGASFCVLLPLPTKGR